MTSIRRLPAFLSPLVCLALVACGGSGGSKVDQTSAPRFLIAGSVGLVEQSGSSQRTLLTYPDGSYIFDPALSSDGKRIAYALQPPAIVTASGDVDFGSDIYVAGRDGKSPQLVLKHGRTGEFLRNPTWLPGDKQLLINVRGRGADGLPDLHIESYDLTTGARQRLVDNAVELGLAPDGKTIAYVALDPVSQRERLTIADLHSGAAQAIQPPDSPLTLMTSLTWSPDGGTLAFAAANPTTASRPPDGIFATAFGLHPTLQDIWLVHRDGSNLHLLADIAESQPSIAWAADGSGLYVLGSSGFWRVDTQTGERQVIGQGVPFGQVLRVDH